MCQAPVLQENANAPPSENNNRSWSVYAIIADNEPEDPFYVGISVDVPARMHQHNHSRDSAAYDRVQALDALGIHCHYDVLATYPTRAEARAYETTMIALHPRLLNRDVAACTRALLAKFGSADG
jgi:predicted GIY-YIG superfamily endonuclease